jgi:hypothetical protein
MSKLFSSTNPGLCHVLAQVNWGVLDQALSSGTNFLVALALVRRVSASEFGAFSIGVIIYVLSIGSARALNAQPLTITSGGSGERVQAAAGRALGMAAAVGLVLGFGCLISAMVVAGPLRTVLVILGMFLPLLLLQDTGRLLCYALGKPRTAAANDAAWAALLLILLSVVLAQPSPALWALVTSWLGSGAFAGILIAAQLRARPTLRGSISWLAEDRSLGLSLVGVYLLSAAPPYLVYALAPAVSSLAELGLARAAYVPFGPFGVLLQSALLQLLPATAGKDAGTTWRLAVRASVAASTLALLWAVLVVALLPTMIGHWLIGDAWNRTGTERAIFGCSLVALAACTGPLVALQSLKAPKRLLRVSIVTTPFVLVVGLLLTWAGGAVGIAVGILTGDVLSAALLWRELRALMAEEPPAKPEFRS